MAVAWGELKKWLFVARLLLKTITFWEAVEFRGEACVVNWTWRGGFLGCVLIKELFWTVRNFAEGAFSTMSVYGSSWERFARVIWGFLLAIEDVVGFEMGRLT